MKLNATMGVIPEKSKAIENLEIIQIKTNSKESNAGLGADGEAYVLT